MEAEQQPAFYQGQATLLGVWNKSPTQHPPGCAPCLKSHCASFPVAVRGPVLTPWDISYQTFTLILEVLLQHKQGGTQVLGWAGEVPEDRRMLVQTGNDSQLRGGLARLHPCCVQAQVQASVKSSCAGRIVSSQEELCCSLWDLCPTAESHCS